MTYEDYRVQEELTIADLSHRCLGRDYPLRITDLCDRVSWNLAAELLAHDPGLILELAGMVHSLMSSDLGKLCRHLEVPLMLVLDDMSRVGIGFKGATCAELVKEMERSMAVLVREISGGASVDLASHEEVHRFLIDQGIALQVPPAQLKRGDLKQTFKHVAHAYPLARKILAWWSLGLELGLPRKWAGHKRIHPVWGQTRSATSRVYARYPAVQSVSRRLRHLLVAAPHHVLVRTDYSQAQMRILAHLSQDPELIRIFYDPDGDVHTETPEWLGPNDRNVAKEINFAIRFGMGPAALSRKINERREAQRDTDFIDEQTALFYIDGSYQRFPNVQGFFDRGWEKIKKLPAEERVVRSLIARERRLPRRPTAKMERQFRVTWPQQIEADLIKTVMLRLNRIFQTEGMQARIVMMGHDSLRGEAPEAEAGRVRGLMRTAMAEAGELDLPLEVDFE